LNKTYKYYIEKDDNGYTAFCPQLDGCFTQGDTREEVVTNIEDAILLHLKDRGVSTDDVLVIEAGNNIEELEKTIIKKGFNSVKEFHHLIAKINFNEMPLLAFKNWQNNNGSKKDLCKLYFNWTGKLLK